MISSTLVEEPIFVIFGNTNRSPNLKVGFFFLKMDIQTKFNIVKSLHLVFMVSWFAALFYMPRLLIYYVESKSMTQDAKDVLQKQYGIMQKRLWYIIGWPAMVLTMVFGVWMLVLRPAFLEQSWMLVKLAFVLCLLFYHFFTHMFYRKQSNEVLALSSFQLRMWNEVATILLIAIIFTVVFKDGMSWVYGVIGILGVAIILAFSVKRYKAWREKKTNSGT